MSNQTADLIAYNGKIATQNEQRSIVEAVAVLDGKFLAIGTDREVMAYRGEQTQLINLNKRTAIPGLNDSHTHLIRGGLNYNLELRWDGVPSLADGLRMLREQARRTPSGQWVRVVGGWSEFQFAERRMPTLDELNKAAPDTPVFVLHLYDRALLNRAALRAVGYTKESPNPPGGEIVRDAAGNPTGLLIARPNAMILYATLAKGPKLPPEYQVNSSRHFMRGRRWQGESKGASKVRYGVGGRLDFCKRRGRSAKTRRPTKRPQLEENRRGGLTIRPRSSPQG